MFRNTFTDENRINEDLNEVLFDGRHCRHFLEVPFDFVRIINGLQFSTRTFKDTKKIRFNFSDNSIKLRTYYQNRENEYGVHLTLIEEGYSYYFPKKAIELEFEQFNEFKSKMNDEYFDIWFCSMTNEKDENELDIFITLRMRTDLKSKHTFKITTVDKK